VLSESPVTGLVHDSTCSRYSYIMLAGFCKCYKIGPVIIYFRKVADQKRKKKKSISD